MDTSKLLDCVHTLDAISCYNGIRNISFLISSDFVLKRGVVVKECFRVM